MTILSLLTTLLWFVALPNAPTQKVLRERGGGAETLKHRVEEACVAEVRETNQALLLAPRQGRRRCRGNVGRPKAFEPAVDGARPQCRGGDVAGHLAGGRHRAPRAEAAKPCRRSYGAVGRGLADVRRGLACVVGRAVGVVV